MSTAGCCGRKSRSHFSSWLRAHGLLRDARAGLEWSTDERRRQGSELIQEEVLPRRMTAVTLADQIQQVSEKQLEASSQEVGELVFAGSGAT